MPQYCRYPLGRTANGREQGLRTIDYSVLIMKPMRRSTLGQMFDASVPMHFRRLRDRLLPQDVWPDCSRRGIDIMFQDIEGFNARTSVHFRCLPSERLLS